MTVALDLLGPIAPPDFEVAPCRQSPSLFFQTGRVAVAEAKDICGTCPELTRLACLEFSLLNREPAGTWGGVSEKERKALLRLDGTRRG